MNLNFERRWRDSLRMLCFSSTFLLLLVPFAVGEDWPHWRGPQRNGTSLETGLLKRWQEPPSLSWHAAGLGEAYSSVVVSRGMVFTIGKHGEELFLFALDEETGKPRWNSRIGSTARNPCSTPTVDSNRVYALDPDGELVCAAVSTGKIIWSRSFIEDFSGVMMSGRGYGESPLIDGDHLICSPGSDEAMIVALDKYTGKTVWTAGIPDLGSGGGQGHGFSSLMISEAAGIRQYVQLIGRGLIGIAADDGRFLWSYTDIANQTANIPTPVVYQDFVFSANGYHAGSVLLNLSSDGKQGIQVEEVYRLSGRQFQNHHGGVVQVENYIFGGHGSNNGLPTCIELDTGNIVWKRRGPGTGSAATTFADGRLYFRYQDGLVALLEASTKRFKLLGTLQIPGAGGDSWAHPVVANGRLFLREKDDLFVYDIQRDHNDRAAETTASESTRGILSQRLSHLPSAQTSSLAKLGRFIVEDNASPESIPVITLTASALTKAGLPHSQILAQLRQQTQPFVLNLAGTQISDDGISTVAQLGQILAINLELCRNITDLSLRHLTKLDHLRVLLVPGTPITDDGIQYLKQMKHLVAIDLEVCDGVTDGSCATLASIKSLQAILMKKTGFEPKRITDAGIQQLSTLPQLEMLDLYGNAISNDGLRFVGQIRTLRELDLSLQAIDDLGLEHLQPLQRLERLDVLYAVGFAGPTIANQGMQTLRGLTNLRHLNLIGAQIDDAALDQLAALQHLEYLQLANTKVTEKGIRKLQAVLPDCQIKP